MSKTKAILGITAVIFGLTALAFGLSTLDKEDNGTFSNYNASVQVSDDMSKVNDWLFIDNLASVTDRVGVNQLTIINTEDGKILKTVYVENSE